MSTKKIGVGIIGYGGMGNWHASYTSDSDAVELIGVYDIREERHELARSKNYGVFASEAELLADPRIQIVTIATPNDTHKEIAIRAMKAGKHVVCEKPVVMTCKDLQDIIDVANAEKKVFSVHQNRRWDVDYLVMKQIRESGELGEIFNIESRIHGSRGIPGDWRAKPENGGGMLFDWAVHLIDQILMVFEGDKVNSVYCLNDHITNSEVDDGFRMILRFTSGVYAHIEVGTYNFINMPRFYIRGEKGTGIITEWTEKCKVTRYTEWYQGEVVPVKTAAGLTKTMAPRDGTTTETYEIDIPKSDVHNYYRNICVAIRGEEESLIRHEQLLRTLRIIELCFESHAQEKIIKLDTPI